MNMMIEGTAGDETLRGGAGDDLIIGHAGNDKLRGGAGFDTFRFDRGDGNDIIVDFQHDMDHVVLVGISMREVAIEDTAKGLVIRYGGFAATSPDAGSILLRDIHELHTGDLLFA
jgi:Ca2+-binding RTX toxin-like protein